MRRCGTDRLVRSAIAWADATRFASPACSRSTSRRPPVCMAPAASPLTTIRRTCWPGAPTASSIAATRSETGTLRRTWPSGWSKRCRAAASAIIGVCTRGPSTAMPCPTATCSTKERPSRIGKRYSQCLDDNCTNLGGRLMPRVGVIKPSTRRGRAEELVMMLPKAIELEHAGCRIASGTRQELEQSFADFETKVAEMAALNVDLIHPAGVPFLLLGYEGERALV